MSTATCKACGQLMTPDSSCLGAIVDESGGEYPRVRYGSDRDRVERKATGPCPDCAVMPGKVHHQHCDQEVCPKCGDQLLMCTVEETCGWVELAEGPDSPVMQRLLRIVKEPTLEDIAFMKSIHAQVTPEEREIAAKKYPPVFEIMNSLKEKYGPGEENWPEGAVMEELEARGFHIDPPDEDEDAAQAKETKP